MSKGRLQLAMIDFHCHLDLYHDPRGIAEQIQDAGVAVLSVTTTPSAFAGTRALADNKPLIRTALGLHPELAGERRHELPLFDDLLPTTAFVGEVGLDGTSRFAQSRATQLEVFRHVLGSCSRVGGRIMSIHSRGAAGKVLETLDAFPEKGSPVLHWFSGTKRQAETAADQGCWFSVGAPMLNSAKGRDLLTVFPRHRVLTETDGPFTTSAGRPSSPAQISATVAQLATFWGMSVKDCESQLQSNLGSLIAANPALPSV